MLLTQAGEAGGFCWDHGVLCGAVLIPLSQSCQFSGPVYLLQAFSKIAGMIFLCKSLV